MSSRLSDASAILESLNGSPTYLGTITGVGGTAVTAASTGVTFTIPAGQRILLQGDTNFYFLPTPSVTTDGQASTAVVVTADNGVLVPAGTERTLCLRTVQNDVSVISGSGPFNIKVFRLD